MTRVVDKVGTHDKQTRTEFTRQVSGTAFLEPNERCLRLALLIHFGWWGKTHLQIAVDIRLGQVSLVINVSIYVIALI